MASAIKMHSPICLIENRIERGRSKLVVNPEAINILSQIQQPVVVVSIVGLYRTGKSYLMNRLAGSQKGFSLGSTIQSETKGIWMWCVPHPTCPDRTLVLLDTEGLGDVEKGDRKNDSKIFTLAVLLSSALVYNSMGTINQDAMDKLKFVGEIAELIKVRTGGIQEEGTFSRYFPLFVWAVRDFSLELKIDGRQVTEDDYLENALKLKTPERTPEDKEFNELRNRLRMYFGKRRCFVFDAPTDSRKQLRELENLSDSNLDEGFVVQSGRFCDYVFKNAEIKRVDLSVDVNGFRLAELAKLYTDAMNSSNVACLEEAVVSLAEKENKIAIQEALKYYENKMRTIPMPTETLQQFLDQSSRLEEEARKIFLKRSIRDKDQKFLEEFLENVKRVRQEFSVTNEAVSRERCAALIRKHSVAFERALSEGTFRKPGGHERFKQGLGALEQNYNMERGKGVKAEEVLQQYMTSKQAAEIIIIQEDNALSQRQKEEEVEKTKNQLDKMKEQLERLKEEQENKKSAEEMANLRATVQQLQFKLEEERNMMNRKLEEVAKEKERERDLYMRQGQQDQAQKYETHIRELQSEKENRGLFSRVGDVVDRWINKLSFWK